MDIRFLIEQLDEITRRGFLTGLGAAGAGYMLGKNDDDTNTEKPKTEPKVEPSKPAPPADPRNPWIYNRMTDQMTGESKGGKAKAWSENGEAILEVYFGPNTKEIVFIEVKNKIINFKVDGTSVRIKAGGKVIGAHLGRPTSGAYDYGGIHEQDNPGLIKRIFAGGEIKVEVPLYREGSKIYTWNVKPFNPDDPWGIKASKKAPSEEPIEEASDEAIARIVELSKDKK